MSDPNSPEENQEAMVVLMDKDGNYHGEIVVKKRNHDKYYRMTRGLNNKDIHKPNQV